MPDTVPATGLLAWSWLLIALPLLGAAVLLIGGRRTNRWGHLLGVATVVLPFVIALLCTFQLGALHSRSVSVPGYTFMAAGDLYIQHGLLVDLLSSAFVSRFT